MVRLEIIANNTVEQDIKEALGAAEEDLRFSRLSGIHGQGRQQPRQGDEVWPEENFMLIIYCSREQALRYAAGIKAVKERFPREGIKVFALPFEEMEL
ncbi:MAG: hypothetical protein PQJ58_17735 [Spirochaetales bacterium]|nr:hypothetical protein [Spirochaetales bacterium]